MKSKTIIQGHEIAGRMPLFQEWGRKAIRAQREKQPKVQPKTQTRRIPKLENLTPSAIDGLDWEFTKSGKLFGVTTERLLEKYISIKVGDIRVMTEPWAVAKCYDSTKPSELQLTQRNVEYVDDKPGYLGKVRGKTRAAMFMPHWAARKLCRIMGVRVGQLQDISEEDAKAEGVPFTCSHCGNDETTDPDGAIHWACDDPEYLESSYREGFKRKWDDINEDRGYPWSKPQLVIAYTFEVV